MDRKPDRHNSFVEIEDTVLNLIQEISRCKTTIGTLDSMVADGLKEKLFISGIDSDQEKISFHQYFGDFSTSMCVIVFSLPETLPTDSCISRNDLLSGQFLQLGHGQDIFYGTENMLFCLT